MPITAPTHTLYGSTRKIANKKTTSLTASSETREFLQQRVSKLGIDCDLWNLIKAIDNRKAPTRPAAAINSPNDQARPAVTDNEKADLFCQAFAAASRVPKKKEEDKPVRRLTRNSIKQACGCDETAQCSTFKHHELELALAQI